MGNRPSNSGNRMSANEPEAEEVSRRDTTDSSDEEEELFSSNLENVSTEDRTFRSILSLLVGRQSVSQTLRYSTVQYTVQFTITEKAPTWAYSWLKASTS